MAEMTFEEFAAALDRCPSCGYCVSGHTLATDDQDHCKTDHGAYLVSPKVLVNIHRHLVATGVDVRAVLEGREVRTDGSGD